MIGLPVIALTDSAAPPRASPSSLLMMTPSKSTVCAELLGDLHGVLAGHRVDDQQDGIGPDRLLDVGELLHQLRVDVQAAARVDDQDVLALGLSAVARPRRDLDRVAVGALLVDRRRRPAAPTLISCSTAAGR